MLRCAVDRDRLSETAASLGERLLVTPGNPISLAMTLDGLAAAAAAATAGGSSDEQPGSKGSHDDVSSSKQGRKVSRHQPASVSFFGSMLWAR